MKLLAILWLKCTFALMGFVSLALFMAVMAWLVFADDSPLPDSGWVRIPIGLFMLSIVLTIVVALI